MCVSETIKTTYLKAEKCIQTAINPVLSHCKRMISPYIEWCIGKCPGLSTLFFKTNTWYLKFMLYNTVIYIFGGYFRIFTFHAQTVL